MKMKLKLLKDLVVGLLVVCSGIIIVGYLVNSHDHKFVKSRGTDCRRGILALNEEDSHICCDNPIYRDTWVCIASFDKINPLFSSHLGAFIIPLIPLLLNALNPAEWKGSMVKRLTIYVSIITTRVLLLWLVPMKIQDLIQGGGKASVICWCADFVSASKCLMLFDFSDHIVLNVVQYMVPCLLETHHSLCQLMHTRSTGLSTGLSTGGTSGGFNVGNYMQLLSLCAAACILFFNMRSMLLTCMFFHTFAENVVGLLIAAVVAAAPLYSRQAATYWVTTISSSKIVR